MNQQEELAKVKARIRALTEKTVSNGCTEAEALAAAEMVGRLLDRYALSMEEIDLRQARCVQKEVPLQGRQRRPVDGCVPAIARFCDCKVWLARDERGMRYVFFGFEADAELAVYLFSVVERGIRSETASFREQHPELTGSALRSASISYQQGMASRIAERLEAMHDERRAAAAAQAGTGTALVVVKHRMVDEAFRETSVRLTAARGRGLRANGAYRKGYAAGGRINLNRPIREQGRGQLE